MARHPITGNLNGISPSQYRALERTFRRRVPPRQVISPELARHLTGLSRELGRQLGVLLNREGSVRHLVVGDAAHLFLPEIGRLRGGAGRFRGLRLLHTHLRGEPLSSDDLNDLALLRLDLVGMLEVTEEGLPGRVEIAYLDPSRLSRPEPDEDPFVRVRVRDLHALQLDFQATIAALEEEFSRMVSRSRGPRDAERALVVGVSPRPDQLEETLELVRSAGVVVAGSFPLRRGRLHPRTLLGKGKLQELVLEGMRRRAGVAIFDVDLKPAQARSFEDATGLKAVDRTQLILDIFAQRARSRDGQLQVELAQLRYALPRLTRKDAGLSRLRGGVGGRGPGETVLEVGRRRIRERIRRLEKQVERLSRQREVRRRRRRRSGIPVLSLVGYTNTGKSTLLNALTQSDVDIANKLFLTLDPTSRRLRFPRRGEVLITDTVGFISDLPPDLKAAFRATLEELGEAHLILHVMDAADPQLAQKTEAVEQLLRELDFARHLPLLRILNKIDRIPSRRASRLAARYQAVPVSARRKWGLERLLEEVEARLGDSHVIDPRP